MKGAADHHHVASLGAGVILSAVAIFVVTPSAAAVLAGGAAGVVLASAPTTTVTRRLTVRAGVATQPTRVRPSLRTSLQPAGPAARGVGVVRRVVGLMLRTALTYLGLSTSGESRRVLTTPFH
jgi:hypothetical protein